MKKIAVVCEYNPFHCGHEYQLNQIKKSYPDAKIIAIMSGHFTQRGDAAAFSKFDRAKAAVACGADIVLELPFPYSSASAETFAAAGCAVAEAVGCDMLCFGSECGDLEELQKIADTIDTPQFREKIKAMRKEPQFRSYGYAALVEKALGSDVIKKPNNILAVEYLRALKFSDIIPITVKRKGAEYKDNSSDIRFPSASALRMLLEQNCTEKMLLLIPDKSASVFASAIERKETVVGASSLNELFLSHFRFISPDKIKTFAECSSDFAYSVKKAANESTNGNDFISALRTKHLTDAKIRRALLFAMLEVESSSICEKPSYTQLLAANKYGCEIAKQIKKLSRIDLLVKPSDFKKMSVTSQKQFELNAKADSLYTLLLSNRLSAGHYLKATPYIEK